MNDVEIALDAHGIGTIKVNGVDLPCTRVVVLSKAGEMPRVRLTLLPARLRIKLANAQVSHGELALTE